MANKSTKHRLQCGLNITNKQSFFPLTLSLSLFLTVSNNYWPSQCCLWSWPILINSFDCRQSQHTTTQQQQHAIHNREYNAKRKAMWESEKWPGANGHVIRKNKIHLLVKVLCFVFMLFIIDFSASSLRFFRTVVVLDSGDLLARNEPMHWEFQIKRAYKMRVRISHSKTAKRETAKRSVGQWQCKASNWLAAKPFAQPRLHPHRHTLCTEVRVLIDSYCRLEMKLAPNIAYMASI